MLLGYISPVKSVLTQNISTIHTDSSKTDTTREELRTALKDSFNTTTFSADQCAQLLDLCTKYRSVFSLSPKELGRCKIAEAEFPLQPGTQPVDRSAYRTNPRVQQVIDKCVKQMETDGIIEQRPSPWGSAVTIVAKADGTPRFCVDYRSTINKKSCSKILANARHECSYRHGSRSEIHHCLRCAKCLPSNTGS